MAYCSRLRLRDGAADSLVSNLAPVTSCHLIDEREQKADENSLHGIGMLIQRSELKKFLDTNRRFTEGMLRAVRCSASFGGCL